MMKKIITEAAVAASNTTVATTATAIATSTYPAKVKVGRSWVLPRTEHPDADAEEALCERIAPTGLTYRHTGTWILPMEVHVPTFIRVLAGKNPQARIRLGGSSTTTRKRGGANIIKRMIYLWVDKGRYAAFDDSSWETVYELSL